MKSLKRYLLSLVNPQLAPTAFKVALVVGSLLLLINHGVAILNRQMSRDRWISALATYLVPYMVNIHGQYIASSKRISN
jgi:hypothetical protein